MRTKAALIIIVIAFAITMANFGASLALTRRSLVETVENDITLALDIANDLVSTRIYLSMSNAQTAAARLSKAESVDEIEMVMRRLFSEFRDFIALTVFDRQGVVAEFGDSTTPGDWLHDSRYALSAFEGESLISSTSYSEATGKLVMYIYTPIDTEQVLSVTIPGIMFSELIGDYTLWNTGNIFLIDEDSTVIAHPNHELVFSRENFISMLKPSSPQGAVDFLNEIASGGKGLGSYVYNGVEYQCAFAQVAADGVINWRIGLTVPLSDSPVIQVQNSLMLLAASFLAVSVFVAIVSSRYIAKPYYRVAQQNRLLEEYTDITNSMMEETLRLQTQLEAALLEAQEANSAKSSFLARMSHEMRTPLNAVIGLSELILNSGEVKGNVETDLGKIHVSGVTLLGLVNGILDISKIESGEFSLNPVNCDTPSLISDIISLNTMRIVEKPLLFRLILDENLPSSFIGDELRIKQIFSNLLSNAIKFTDTGIVEWMVTFERDGGDIWLISSVSDTGIGIKPEDIPSLFQDYSQIHTGTSREAEGTGLGLSITKRLASLMGGTVEVESEFGKGSKFSVRLKQQFSTDRPIGKETAENLMSYNYTTHRPAQWAGFIRIDLSYARVLVVDDMPTNLDVARGMLSPYGMRVDCTGSGAQAVEIIREQKCKYDAVFMDHMMPGMDGVEATRIIRGEIDSDYARSVPIIALTANAVTGNEKMFLENGFQAFVSKPIDVIRLDSVLREWVMDKDREPVYCVEKWEGADSPEASGSATGGYYAGCLTISGIDVASGLERFAGNEKAYVKVLQTFSVNTRLTLGEMERAMAAGSFNDYAIAVHGIKGASLGVGAAFAGAEADRLESMAKAGDFGRVASENGKFTEYMRNLLGSVDSALSEYYSINKKPVKSAPDPELLRELRDACEKYAAGRVEKALTELESYDYESGADLVIWLRGQIEEMNYDVVAEGDYDVR